MRTIPKAESLDIEFKSDLKCYPDHDLIEEIVGMTNTSGGFLFLGVEDDGSITGVHKKHKDPIGVTAVSYTHLDVYKRQLFLRGLIHFII